MTDLLVGIGLVLFLEGALYTLFPENMQKMMQQALEMPPSSLRQAGLIACLAGFTVIWFVRTGN